MRTFARITDGVVSELIQSETDISTNFHPSLLFVEVTGTNTAIGWLWTGNTFEAPQPTQSTLRVPTLLELESSIASLMEQVAALRAQS